MASDPIAAVRSLLGQHDPDVLAAVADVDRSLIRAMLALRPEQRLAKAFQMSRGLRALAVTRRSSTMGTMGTTGPDERAR
jgi:hypothetical protein